MVKRSPLLTIILVAILAYWPVAFCVHTFKWDMLDVVLPFRYFTGECIKYGVFPVWNPYIFTGVPVCADLQYPLWSPEVWLFGLTTGYSIYTMHLLFISYIIIAGYGMYRVTLYFNGHRQAALLAGIAYMLSGFITGHGQALFSIIGAAWLPWVVLYTIKLCNKPSLYRTLKLTLFIFLMISTGYQFLSIITGYLLLAIFIYYSVKYFKHSDPRLRKLLSYSGLLAIFTLLVCLVILVPVIQALGYNERISSGVRYEKSILFPFTWQSLISLAVPFSTVKYPEFFHTDISMRNMYCGLIMLILFFSLLFRKRSGVQWLILVFGSVCLLASFGPALPVHKILFAHFPLIHMLRMPAYFNLFFIFAVILITGIGIPAIYSQESRSLQRFKRLTLSAIIIMVPLLIFSLFHSAPWPPVSGFFRDHFNYLRSLTFHSHILIQAPLQIFLLILLYLSLKKNHLQSRLFFLVCAEMIVAVNLNSSFTVYDIVKPGQIHRFMKSQPAGFPIPSQTPIAQNSDHELNHSPLWRNMGILTKKISYDGFSSFVLKPFNYVDDSLPVLRDSLIMNPPVFLSGRVFRNADAFIPHRVYRHNDLYLDDKTYSLLPVNLKEGATDTIPEIVSFSPSECTITYDLDTASVITYMQADYPGWKVSIDGGKTEHFTSNFMYLSTIAPAGKHTIIFRYDNRIVFASFLISFTFFTVLLAALLFLAFWRI